MEQFHKNTAIQKSFSYLIFFILLIIRILVVDPINNIGHFLGLFNFSDEGFFKILQNVSSYLLISWSYFLVGLVIVGNRKNLEELNIDRGLIFLFILCGLSYWKYFPIPTGWMVLIISVFIIMLYKKQQFSFPNFEIATWKIIIIIIAAFLLGLLFMHSFISTVRAFSVVRDLIYISPFVLLEEVIFRSLLWMLLTNLRWPSQMIVVTQGFLFWISHINNMIADPIFFWVLVPISSLLYGEIVKRSKSITASFIAHMLINFLLGFR